MLMVAIPFICIFIFIHLFYNHLTLCIYLLIAKTGLLKWMHEKWIRLVPVLPKGSCITLIKKIGFVYLKYSLCGNWQVFDK